MKNIFIVGSKGIPAKYGGFETFVDQLVSGKKSKDIQYYVSCLSDDGKSDSYEYHGAICQKITVPDIGSAKAILYDIQSLKWVINTIKSKRLKNGIVYILACRIGPFIHRYVAELHKFGFKVYVNPDGHEWKRAKWILPIKKYWKISEKLMVKYADLLICDSKGIESYIQEEYRQYKPKTNFIAYGADTNRTKLTFEDKEVRSWYEEHDVVEGQYFLIVGRFVPENNYKTMINEFMQSTVNKDLVIITNIQQNKFYDELKYSTNFNRDKRIKFVGTVYNKELLKYIRENAFAYLHGHEVGGTNPSLLEALGSTKINLLLDVNFNREVGQKTALYWNKDKGSLSSLLDEVVSLSPEKIEKMGLESTQRINNSYSWNKIIDEYECLFVEGVEHENFRV